MRKIFIFIILIIQNACAPLTSEEIYNSISDYKAWALTTDASKGYYSYRYRNQGEANRAAIAECETQTNKTCLLYMSGDYHIWQRSVDNYNRNIQNEHEKTRKEIEESPPSYSCSRGKCTAN